MLTAVKTKAELDAMRVSGQILASVLRLLSKELQVGMSTKDLANLADKELSKLGGEAAFLGHQGFPDVICISVNEEVVHGIPRTSKIIKSGDVVSLDFGVSYNGMITDGAISLIAGSANQHDKELIEHTKEALNAGIIVVKNGTRTGDIGSAVESVLSKYRLGIVRDLVGHGVGHQVHEDPNIPNYGFKNTGERLVTGMTIAIEPMATLGTDAVAVKDDGWTIVTMDGSRAAHFEHTVLVTEKGAEVLTFPSNN